VHKSLSIVAMLALAACESSGAKSRAPCDLMTLDDAKSLIGADAKRDADAAPGFTTKDATCWYQAGANDHAFVIVEKAAGSTWTSFKQRSDTQKIDGLADEAYFMNDSDTLWLRKGETVLILDIYVAAKANEQKATEQAFARKLLPKL